MKEAYSSVLKALLQQQVTWWAPLSALKKQQHKKPLLKKYELKNGERNGCVGV